jgi:hypothetical protein
MNMIRQIAGAMLVFATLRCPAAEPQETVTLLYGATTYSAEVADLPESRIQSDHPELLRPPSIGDKLTYCVDSGTNQLRRLIGMVVASNKLVCIDGPEIRVDGGPNRMLHSLRGITGHPRKSGSFYWMNNYEAPAMRCRAPHKVRRPVSMGVQ